MNWEIKTLYLNWDIDLTGMSKPQYIVDDEGRRISVILSIKDYESLIEELDDPYCNRLLERALEANEPSMPLEEYLKKRNQSKDG